MYPPTAHPRIPRVSSLWSFRLEVHDVVPSWMKSFNQFSLSEAGDSGDELDYTHIPCSSDSVTDESRSLPCKRLERSQTHVAVAGAWES